MSKRYAAYTRLKLDYPSKRILRHHIRPARDLQFGRCGNPYPAHQYLARHRRRPDINAVIITGAGKVFSAGGDFD